MDERVAAIVQNKVDLVVFELTVTKERVREVDFSYPYYSVQIGVLTKADGSLFGNIYLGFSQNRLVAQKA